MPFTTGHNAVYGNRERVGDQIPRGTELRPNIDNNPICNTSIPLPAYGFQERAEAIQRGGQQASGYYQKDIRNDDTTTRRSDLVPMAEDYSYPKREIAIKRGNAQASGYFNKSIQNDDVTHLVASSVSMPLHDQTSKGLHSELQTSQTSKGLHSELQTSQNTGQNTNKYWYTMGDDAPIHTQHLDPRPSRADRVSHLGGAGLTSNEPTRPTRPNPDTGGMGRSNALDRVIEWETADDGVYDHTYQNEQQQQQPLRQQITEEVLLQPRTLLPRLDVLVPMQSNTNEPLDNQNSFPAAQHYADDQAFNRRFNHPVFSQDPEPEVAPSHLIPRQDALFETQQGVDSFKPTSSDAWQKKARYDKNDIILIGVVILCFVLTAVAVVIMVEAV